MYLASILEYLCAEVRTSSAFQVAYVQVLELSGNAAADNKKKQIRARHIMLAVRNDNELNELLKDVHIAEGGVIPHLHPSLPPKKLQQAPEVPVADQ